MTTSNAQSLGAGTPDSSQLFVINLCSSTSPMALAHPSSPELKRHTFFVSRQRHDGRDRFRLHMGYFQTQEEAEKLLEAVRDVYPAAWAGPAPAQGNARRARMKQVEAPAPRTEAPPLAIASAPMPAAPPAAEPAVVAPALPEVAAAVAETVVAAAPVKSPDSLELTMSEMRDVLSRLDEAPPAQPEIVPNPPVVQPVRSVVRPQPAVAPIPSGIMDPPRLQPVEQPRLAGKARPASSPAPELAPEQALSLLESATPPVQAAPEDSRIQLLTPEDTQTLRDIKLDKANNAPPSFAVQLIWSVTPINAAAMPHLAIFDAYTLYNVEGNRQGRKWYGLRLGFFTDPNSATQVANYVRGDYKSVAVVPVSTREMDRAGGGSGVSPADSAINPPLKPSEQLSTNRETMVGFELVADDRPVARKRDLDSPPAKVPTVNGAPRPVPAKAGPGKVAPKPAGKPTGKRAVARKKPERTIKLAPGSGDVLESTLEILGASTLTIDDNKGVVIGDSAARRSSAAAKKPQNNKFAKLLSRLGGG